MLTTNTHLLDMTSLGTKEARSHGLAIYWTPKRLSPGCMIAWAFCDLENKGLHLSIEILRACMDAAPSWPHRWTRQEGIDFTSAFLSL